MSGLKGWGSVSPEMCVIGFAKGFLRRIEPFARPGSVVVLEEPDLLRKRHLREAWREFPCISQLIEASYIGTDDYLQVAEDLHASKPFEAVVTVLEYAVVAAATLAERLGLPGAGIDAARTLTDKLRLREITGGAGVLNPRWAPVVSAEEARAFAGGLPLVIKPNNRQASVGVHVVDDLRQLDDAWLQLVASTDAEHLPDRQIETSYIAERRLLGREVSVETLVRDGVVLFENYTEKWVAPGPHPVERGHVVPARLSIDDTGRLAAASRRLIDATGFGTGVLHAEWMLTDRGPALIECAGRMPGDRIVELIDAAWGFNFCQSMVKVLAGRTPQCPSSADAAACVIFLGGVSGQLLAIEGADEARRTPGVVDVDITVQPGQTLTPWLSSWDRAGNILVTAENPDDAAAIAQKASDAVRLVTPAADA